MKRTAAILITVGWTVAFALVAVIALYGTDGGDGSSGSMLAGLRDDLALQTLPARAVMGGLCFGATVVAALFATVALSIVLMAEDSAAHTRFLTEIAHGGAFGIAGVVTVLLALSGTGLLLGGTLIALALLVASLLSLRSALSDDAVQPLSPPVVARQMAEAAAANVNVVRFPYYRAGGAA